MVVALNNSAFSKPHSASSLNRREYILNMFICLIFIFSVQHSLNFWYTLYPITFSTIIKHFSFVKQVFFACIPLLHSSLTGPYLEVEVYFFRTSWPEQLLKFRYRKVMYTEERPLQLLRQLQQLSYLYNCLCLSCLICYYVVLTLYILKWKKRNRLQVLYYRL